MYNPRKNTPDSSTKCVAASGRVIYAHPGCFALEPRVDWATGPTTAVIIID